MQPLRKQKYFYYIALMLMASTFLPLVFNNLPRVIGSHHLWTIIWVTSLLVFNSKIFLNKVIVYVIVYGVLLFISTKTIWNSIDYYNNRNLFIEFYEIAIGISVITYFFKSKDYIGLARITKWSIVFLFITAIMSIISSAIDPMYARNLIGISAVTDVSIREQILGFKKYGGGTYSTAAAFMCLLPILIYYYKNNKISLLSKKLIIILFIIISLALFGMQIFGNILIAISFSFFALLGLNKIRQSFLVVVIFISIVLIVPKETYIKSILFISDYFEKDSELNYKFKDIALFIDKGAKINESSTGAGGRAARYPLLMKTFVKSPLLGCYFFSDSTGNGYNGAGMHLYWMNKLTVTGIIGLLIFIYIPYGFIKNNLRRFNSIYKFYYILASLSILSYGIIKVVAGRDTWYAFFIILPGLYYLPLIKKENKLNQLSDNSLNKQA